jgi:hypothetical protein
VRCNLHLINNRVIFYVRNGLSGVTEGRWPSRGDTHTARTRIIGRRAVADSQQRIHTHIYIYIHTHIICGIRIAGSGQRRPGLSRAQWRRAADEGITRSRVRQIIACHPASAIHVLYTYTRTHADKLDCAYTHGLRVRLIFHKSAWLSPEIVFRAGRRRAIYMCCVCVCYVYARRGPKIL